MASALNLTASPNFPQGTSIGAYPRRFWAGKAPEPGEAGRGTPAATAVVDSHGYALFSGLESGETFYCGALVSGIWQWKTAQTPAPEGTGGEGGSGTVTSVNGVSPSEAGAVALPGLNNPNGELPSKVVTSAIVSLGSTLTGSVALDLGQGHIFKGTMTGNVVLQKPTNFAGTARLYFEVELEGKHAIDTSFLKGWRYGGPPDLTGTVSPTNLQFYTDDGTNFYGLGVDGIPSYYARLGSILGGQFAVLNESTGALDGATPPTGVSPSALAAAIAALGLPVFESQHNSFALTDESGVSHYELFPERVLLLAQGRLKLGATATSTKTLPLVVDVFYRITKKAITLTLPTGVVCLGGNLLILANDSEGAVKVTGPFNPESEATSTKELDPGETVWYMCDEGAIHWRPVARFSQGGDPRAPQINTTGKTSNQITKAYEEAFSPEKPPLEGSLLVDNTNHLLLEYNKATAKWFKSAALTEIT